MQEGDAEQPTMQSRSQCSSSDDHILINERKWEDITANEYSSKYDMGHHVLKFVGQLVRHENRRHREADGAFHWRLIRQKLKFTFLKQGGDAFTDRDLINNIWKGSSKTRFKYCQNSCGILLYIQTFQVHTERFDRSRVEGSCRHTFQVEILPISPRVLIQLEIHFGSGTRCREKRKPRRTTNCGLHSLGSLAKRD